MDAASIRSLQYVDKQLQQRKVEDISLLPKEVRKEIRKEAKKIAHQDVFGVDHKTAKDGAPIEQGLGSAGNMTQNAIDAYIANQTDPRRRSGPPEEGYEDTLKKMRQQLVEANHRRRAERAAAEDDDD